MFGMCVVNFENHCRVEGGEVWLKFGQWKERTSGIGEICTLEPSANVARMLMVAVSLDCCAFCLSSMVIFMCGLTLSQYRTIVAVVQLCGCLI